MEAKELYESKKELLEQYEEELKAYLIDSLNGKINRSSNKIVSAMQDYIKEFPTFTKDVDASTASIREFEKMYNVLKKDNLPKYGEKR